MPSKIPSEHAEQVSLVNWFHKNYPGVLIFAVPNGGYRDKKTAEKLVAEGVIKGIPDLFVPEWKLWVEMKRVKGGYLSKEQREVIPYLQECGYTVIVGKGCIDAKQKIEEFRNASV